MSRIPGRDALLIFLGLAVGGISVYFATGRSTAERPAAETAVRKTEERGGEGTVEMDSSKIAAARISVDVAGPALLRRTLRLNGTIQPNQERTSQVTPRFSGVVRDVRKRLGNQVEKGETLAVVESNTSLTTYELKSPITGTIIERGVALGEYASEQKPAFVVADLSSVWIDFTVFRRDFDKLRVGQNVVIDVDDGGPSIEARINYISPIGASDTQSALARAVVDNRDGRLRPALFVTGRLVLAEQQVALAVKTSALQTLDNRTVVFVQKGDAFGPKPVLIGDRDAERVEIKSGLATGDRYAAENSFVIKAEMGKGSAERGD